MSTLLELDRISHAYGAQVIVNELSFELEKGEIGCLLGPSGCGKTTVLRCIAGFEPIVSGEIRLNEISVSRAGFVLPPEQRRVGMVFQEYALFPHLTVTANVGFGLHRSTKAERAHRVAELLQITGLMEVANRYPHELSGGQQQRVALVRALAPYPDLILLDEPFSNLDVSLREYLGQEIRELLKKLNITAILVTHDQAEAFAVADKIGVMHAGKMMQWSSAHELYHCPANRFIADFIGQGTLIPGKVTHSDKVETELGTLAGNIYHPGHSSREIAGSQVDVLIRPDDVIHDNDSSLRAVVVHKAFRGAQFLYTLRLASGQSVLSLISSHYDHAIGEKIGIRPQTDHIVVFDRVNSQ